MAHSSAHLNAADFARMCGTTKRTLIHYENIGLFLPAGRDQNGYRYYSEVQYDVFMVITWLKDLGMSLDEIAAYIRVRDPEHFKDLLLQQVVKIDAEIRHLLQINTMIHTKLQLLDEGERMPHGVVRFTHVPEEYLILSDPINSADHGVKSAVLYRHLRECNQHNIYSGHPYGAIIAGENIVSRNYGVYACHFTKVASYSPLTRMYKKPAGTYAVYYLKGDYRYTDEIYDLMLQAIDESGYLVSGNSYKEGIIEEMVEKNLTDYIVKISIQIAPKAQRHDGGDGPCIKE